MKLSAGIAVIWNKKVLMVHSKNASWFKTYTPPKGGIEEGEETIDAAIRECKEEVGITIKKDLLVKAPVEILYSNAQGSVYKKVILFPLYIKKLSEVSLKSERVPSEQLQTEEVDDAKFMSLEEFKERILPRYYEPLKKMLEES